MKFRVLTILLLTILLLSIPAVTAKETPSLLSQYREDTNFTELNFTPNLTGFHYQRMIGDAIVEGDKSYAVFNSSGELITSESHWRNDLPAKLPANLTAAEEAIEMAGRTNTSRAYLYYISPNSSIFQLDPTPENPCWVVWETREMKLSNNETLPYRFGTIVDAVTGEVLAFGTPPITNYEPVEPESVASSEPVGLGSNPEVFLLGGPYNLKNCSSGWYDEALDAAAYFEEMGYSTLTLEYPSNEVVETYISNLDTAIFVEMSHGEAHKFYNGCPDITYDEDMRAWMANYPKMPFSFLYGCYIACTPAPQEEHSIIGALMKGSSEDTAAVGFCNLPQPMCDACYEWDWTWEFLKWLKLGQTVENAYGIACAAVPGCCTGDYPCARYFGDPNLELVPKIHRSPAPSSIVEGEVRDTNANLLSGAEVSLYKHGDGLYDSDIASPDYRIEVDQYGEYWLVASKTKHYDINTTDDTTLSGIAFDIDFTTYSKLAAGYTFDFEGSYGLIPTKCDLSYFLRSANLWKIGCAAHPEYNLSEWKVMDVSNSWLYPS
jgi:hypothetical protein